MGRGRDGTAEDGTGQGGAARDGPDLDRELAGLAAGQRRREWMRRIEAVLFASASPVGPADLARVVGRDVAVELLVEDLAAELEGRSFEVAKVAGGWMMRTRPAYGPVIRAARRAAAQADDPPADLSEADVAVLAAIAWHQPITREGLKEIFGHEIGRDRIGRLSARGLVATGPREPRRGAPYTYVTTDAFLAAFGMDSLRDLPDPDALADAGLAAP